MSTAAFYYKLNKKIDSQTPVGTIVPMVTNSNSAVYKPSGDVIDTVEYPLTNVLNINGNLSAIETIEFPLLSQIPLNYVASSPSEIVAIGLNSKIYRSTNGETWTSIECLDVSGSFTNCQLYIGYIPSLSKFYIVSRKGVPTGITTENIYTSSDGITWDTTDYGTIPAPNPPTSNTSSGCEVTGLTRWVPHLASFARPFSYVTYDYDFIVDQANIEVAPGVFRSISHSVATYVHNVVLKYNLLTTISTTSVLDSNTWNLWTLYSYYAFSPYNWAVVPSPWVGSYSVFPGHLIPCSDHVFSHFSVPAGPIHCVNGNYQNKIFFQNGYTLAPNTFTAYASSFTFPSTNIVMTYDVLGARYVALNRDTNQCYTSTNGTTWSSPITIDGGICYINNLSIRHTETRFIATGSVVKTSETNAATWTSQTFATVGGTFTKIAISTTGVAIISPLASSTVLRSTTSQNFDLVSVSDTADWQNVYYDGTKFILTSRTKTMKISTDGLTWATQTPHTAFTNSAHYITSMTHYLANYCAISVSSVDTLTSTDGLTWVKRASTIPVAMNSVLMVRLPDATIRTVCVGTNLCYYNSDYGVSAFTNASDAGMTSGNWSNLIWAQNKFVCISLNSLKLAWSLNGIVWTIVTTPMQPCSLVYTDSKFIIKGLGTLTTSTDLVNFTLAQPCDVTTSGGKTIYDSTNNKIITCNSTSVAYASTLANTRIRLPYVASTTPGTLNYIKVA